MRRYFLLMREDGVDFSGLPGAEREALARRFRDWTTWLREAGRLRGVGRLEAGGRILRGELAGPDPDCSLVRAAESRVESADPLAVGLHVIDARDDDEAVELARGCPLVALGGTVEVREVRGSIS